MTTVRVFRSGVDTPAPVTTAIRVYRQGVLAPTVTTTIRVYRSGVQAANVPPYAGPDQVDIEPFTTVTIAATDPDSVPVWTQTGGSPTVTLIPQGPDGSVVTRTFVAPATLNGTTLTFTANDGITTDSMTVTVFPHNEWMRDANGNLTGVWVNA